MSEIPALVLTGELDPITPPRWGETVAAALTNGHFFAFPFTGHGVVVAHECGVRMMHAFFDDPAVAPDASCIDEIEPPAFTANELAIELTPFQHDEAGFTSVRPEGWTEVLPGFYQESALVVLAQLTAPAASRPFILAQVATQIGAETAVEPVGQRRSEFLTWDLYEVDDLGQSVDIAIAEHDGQLLLIQLSATPQRRDAYFAQVFLPAVDALNPAP